MRRRDLLTTFSVVAVAVSLPGRAQQLGARRRIGILHDYETDDPEGRLQIAAFREELRKLGWIDGDNIEVHCRSGVVEGDRLPAAAAEVLAGQPDVVLGAGGSIVAALQRASRSVPIVFVNVTDPVGGGLVAALSRPAGMTTGFTQFEFGLSAKWLEILKELVPSVTRVAVIRDPVARSGGGQIDENVRTAPESLNLS